VFWVLFDNTGDVKYIKKDVYSGTLAFFDNEADASLAKQITHNTDYKRVEYYTTPQPAPTAAQDVACSQSRESSMVVLERDEYGKPAVWCDPEIADLVSALNEAGIRTVASCSGHGHRPGNIMLADGRELVIARDFDEARKIDAMFPGINGEPPMVDVAGLVEALEHEFPLLQDDGLDEVAHHCEWAIQQDRKRLHALIAAHQQREEQPHDSE